MSAREAVFALCRAGFEREAADDVSRALARPAGPLVFDQGTEAGVVAAAVARAESSDLRAALASPIFLRNAAVGSGPLMLVQREAIPRPDRMTPLMTAIDALACETGHAPPWRSVWVEYPDTNEGKQRSPLARALQARLHGALQASGRLADNAPLRLHVLLADPLRAYVGTSDAAVSRWPLGIPRISRARAAPSRSVQKLAEAFVVLLGERAAALLKPGRRAVDLGAAPGGWTWLLAQHGLRVTAVDNGPLKGEVAHDSLVTHVRADGLTFRPRRPVDWLTCDIVEQPIRITDVVAGWIADGAARHAIFNLKLPMKKRYDEVRRCEAHIAARLSRAGARASLVVRQLYHDREEVTGYLSSAP